MAKNTIPDGYLDDLFGEEQKRAADPLATPAHRRRKKTPRKGGLSDVSRPAVQPAIGEAQVAVSGRYVDLLDSIVEGLRGRSAIKVGRAEVLEALLAAVDESGIELSNVRSPEELRERLRARLDAGALLELPRAAADFSWRMLASLAGGIGGKPR